MLSSAASCVGHKRLQTLEGLGATDRLSPGPWSWPGPWCWLAARSSPFSGHGRVSFTDSLFSIRFLLSQSESLQPTNSTVPSGGGGLQTLTDPQFGFFIGSLSVAE